MRNIPDNNLAYPILIFLDNKSSASAFNLHSKDKIFLVTAKHVLFNELDELRSKTIEAHCPTEDPEDDSTLILSIDLTKAKTIAHKDSDICVIFIANVSLSKSKSEGQFIPHYVSGVEVIQEGISPSILVASEVTKKIHDTLVSNDTYLYGYPTSLGLNHGEDFDFTKPLLRRGIISNINLKKGTIILDCRTDFGNSGGPVTQVTNIDGEEEHMVIGVVSKSVTLKNEWVNHRDGSRYTENTNAGYTIVVSMDKVFELTDSHL